MIPIQDENFLIFEQAYESSSSGCKDCCHLVLAICLKTFSRLGLDEMIPSEILLVT